MIGVLKYLKLVDIKVMGFLKRMKLVGKNIRSSKADQIVNKYDGGPKLGQIG